jgi:hypothetical protein
MMNQLQVFLPQARYMIDIPLHKRRKKETKKSSTKLQTEAHREREREVANFSSYKKRKKKAQNETGLNLCHKIDNTTATAERFQ